jgi:hypothetical protein
MQRAGGPSTAAPTTRRSSDAADPERGDPAPAETVVDPLLKCNKGERALSEKYGVRIGPAPDDPNPKHVTGAMLKRIDAAISHCRRRTCARTRPWSLWR